MNGKKYRQSKQRMTAMEMKAEQELDIGLKSQENGSLGDAFRLFRDSIECCFLLFLFWNKEPAGKKVKMCGGQQRD